MRNQSQPHAGNISKNT